MIDYPTGDDFESADDGNIPVDIWLTHDKDGQVWRLQAANYTPRKAVVSDSEAYLAESTDRTELAELVKTKIIPIYEKALNKLHMIVNGEADNLYYWD